MKKQTSREELERLVMAEIAASQKCPTGIKIVIVRSEEGGWDVAKPQHQDGRAICVKRVLAIAARLRIEFALAE